MSDVKRVNLVCPNCGASAKVSLYDDTWGPKLYPGDYSAGYRGPTELRCHKCDKEFIAAFSKESCCGMTVEQYDLWKHKRSNPPDKIMEYLRGKSIYACWEIKGDLGGKWRVVSHPVPTTEGEYVFPIGDTIYSFVWTV